MPTYEYACDACGNGFEVVQKMSDAAIEQCPSCGKKVRRVLTGGIGVSFKGSGFYVTDSGKSGKEGVKPAAPATSTPSCAGCSGNKA